MAKHSFRSDCSIARTLELVGDKWTLLVVRDLMWHGKRTFQALQDSAEHVPSNILSERLKRLADWGLVERRAYQQRPVRYAYHLTDEGKSLEPVLLQVMAWGHKHLGGGRYDPKSGRSSRRAGVTANTDLACVVDRRRRPGRLTRNGAVADKR